jgi:hypothetical protein
MRSFGVGLISLIILHGTEFSHAKTPRDNQVESNQNLTKTIVRETCRLMAEEHQLSCKERGTAFLKKHSTVPCRGKAFELYRYNLISYLCSSIPEHTKRASCYFDAYSEAFPPTAAQIERASCIADRTFRRKSPECFSAFLKAISPPCTVFKGKRSEILGTKSYAICFEEFLTKESDSTFTKVTELVKEIPLNSEIGNFEEKDCGTKESEILQDVMAASASIKKPDSQEDTKTLPVPPSRALTPK